METAQKSPPSIDHLGIPILDPPETLSKRPFDLAFNRVNLIASNPPLPLELRVIQAPIKIWRRPTCAFGLLQLQVLHRHHLGLLLWWWGIRRRVWIYTVRPEIMRVWSGSGTIVALHLHPPICIGLWSVISHGFSERLIKLRVGSSGFGRNWVSGILWICQIWGPKRE